MIGRALESTSYDRYRRAALQLCRAIGMPVAETEFDHGYAGESGGRLVYVGPFTGTGATQKDALAGLVAELRIALRGARCYAGKRLDELNAADSAAENLGFYPMFEPVAVCASCLREWDPLLGEWPASDPPTRTCVCGATVTRRPGAPVMAGRSDRAP